jgi:hypothetical protein
VKREHLQDMGPALLGITEQRGPDNSTGGRLADRQRPSNLSIQLGSWLAELLTRTRNISGTLPLRRRSRSSAAATTSTQVVRSSFRPIAKFNLSKTF